jgi:DNA repair protein RadC
MMQVGPSSTLVTDPRSAAALFADLLAGPHERAAVLYLDPEWRFLGRAVFTGRGDAIAPPLRAIIAEAFRLDAAVLVLGHTHPSGCPDPSPADVAYTRALVRVAQALDLVVADHLILAGGQVTSFRAAGLL